MQKVRLTILVFLMVVVSLALAMAAPPLETVFEGKWEGNWINTLRSKPVGLWVKLDVQSSGVCFYSNIGNTERGIKASTNNPPRRYRLNGDGTTLSFNGIGNGADKAFTFEVIQTGCLKEDPRQPGHAIEALGPCLHGRDSKNPNAHGYLFRAQK